MSPPPGRPKEGSVPPGGTARSARVQRMTARTVAAIACLVVGVGLAAWSLANGQLLLAIVGFALIFTFLYLVMEAARRQASQTRDQARRQLGVEHER